MGLGVFGDDVVLVLGGAEPEQSSLERGDSLQAPGGVGEGLHQLLFEDAFGLELGEEFICEVMISVEILFGQDYRVAGQAVAQRVQRRSLFAGFGFEAS